MSNLQVVREWRESAADAIAALQAWQDALIAWACNGGRELTPGDFDAAFNRLYQAGLGDWADGNPAGGGLDVLAEAVTGREA